MPSFTSIVYEAYLLGAWVDISDDVLARPEAKFSRGASGNKPEDKLADPGKLEFSLNNSITNSAGLSGYYSPGHTNCRGGWDAGAPVRLTFSYLHYSRIKWQGIIEPEGIKVIPGVYSDRRVDVSCYDYMGELAYHRMELLQRQLNQTSGEAAALVIANVPAAPATTYYNGNAVFDYLFDNLSSDTTALGELNKIAISGNTYIFVKSTYKSGEQFTVDDSGEAWTIPDTDSTDAILLEDGTNLLLEDGTNLLMDVTEPFDITAADIDGADITYGANVYNFVTVINYPRQIGTTAVNLFALQEAVELTPGASITLRAPYHDLTGAKTQQVNGYDFVTPVSTTDYKANAAANGTGADRTANLSITVNYGAQEAEVILTNTSGVNTIYTGGETAGAFLHLRGKMITIYEPTRAVAKDTASIAQFGTRPFVIDRRYSNDVSAGLTYANIFKGTYANPHYDVNRLTLVANRDDRNMMAFLFGEPHDTTSVTETMTGLTNTDNFFVNGYEATIYPGKIVKWDVILKRI
jgi:hypothetical protein